MKGVYEQLVNATYKFYLFLNFPKDFICMYRRDRMNEVMYISIEQYSSGTGLVSNNSWILKLILMKKSNSAETEVSSVIVHWLSVLK